MISSIFGTISHISELKVVVVQSGIGFELFCPHAAECTIDQPITLQVYLHWSAENGPTLFGFKNSTDKDLFCTIISCSGIGPKLGLTILSNISASEFIQAICQENSSVLSSIKGVGSKKAEQLIIQLKDKVSKLAQTGTISKDNQVIAAWVDLHQTLNSLHYSPTEIKIATTQLKQEIGVQNIPFDLLLRKALLLLAKK
ncbi:Holliday junction branch migration protein RuvA [Candidatus Babeliales bacterium]|nr:Holliday junction branch migration protein RuvA [Candidatus Babeliales bacterium]